jgi:hypothetical protein
MQPLSEENIATCWIFRSSIDELVIIPVPREGNHYSEELPPKVQAVIPDEWLAPLFLEGRLRGLRILDTPRCLEGNDVYLVGLDYMCRRVATR